MGAEKAAPRLEALNGVRGIASLLIVFTHGFTVWGGFVPEKVVTEAIRSKLWVRAIHNTGMGVDAFLVLSGLLASWSLVPALTAAGPGSPRSHKAVVLDYWKKRCARILPAYLALHLVLWLWMGPISELKGDVIHHLGFFACPHTFWANLAFLNNAVGLFACGGHLWTISVLVHFYLALPLLMVALRPRRPAFRRRLVLAVCLAAAAGSWYRLASAQAAGDKLRLPISWSPDAGPHGLERHMLFVPTQYLSTAGRLPALAVGVLLGMLLRDPAALSWLSHRKWLVSLAAFSLQAAWASSPFMANAYGSDPAQDWGVAASHRFIALLWHGSPFYAALIGATLLALVLQADPIHAAAARLLSLPSLATLADLSYPLYLFHMSAMHWLLYWGGLVLGSSYRALVAAAPLPGLLLLITGTLVAGSAAAALWLFIERRFLMRA